MKKLGFGLMRLPLNTPGNAADIDLAATQAMMDRFLQAGFTYFDTYHFSKFIYCNNRIII